LRVVDGGKRGGVCVLGKFNAAGYLDAGLHPMGSVDIEKAFVASFPHSSTRKKIFAGYCHHYSELAAIISHFEQYLDGSFISNKNDPGDIDLVVLIDATVVDALTPAQQAKLRELLNSAVARPKFGCDTYFCPVYPKGHPHENEARAQRKYWLGEFGYDRIDVPKGIVHVIYQHQAQQSTTTVLQSQTTAGPASANNLGTP
jgi:hypothetical protein